MIKFYNRKEKKYEIEKVAGDSALNILYSTPLGKASLELLIKRKMISSIYGKYCDSFFSKKKIDNFIRDFEIDMSLCDTSSDEFRNFNDFFVRKLNKEARPIDLDEEAFISCGDGRLTAYENIDIDKVVQVKGFTYSLKELIEDSKLSDKYKDGTCLILRLNPTDYHRFHFIDDGKCEKAKKIKGGYYSVNPIALKKIPKLFCENKREYSIFHSDNFGDILYVEVGATCVGSIIQSYKENSIVKKGDEKGYFKFGGSTVIMFLEKERIKIDDDILEESNKEIETKVLMGETIGRKLSCF